MIYKTDLGGFVRSSLMNVSDILESSDGMRALFFVSDPESTFEVFNYDFINGILTRNNLNVSNLVLNCDPDDDLVRMLPNTHTSYFSTLPKQTALVKCPNQTNIDPDTDVSTNSVLRLEDDLYFIDHKITWLNPVNTYGVITWICIGSLVMIIIVCILKNIISYKKQNNYNQIT